MKQTPLSKYEKEFFSIPRKKGFVAFLKGKLEERDLAVCAKCETRKHIATVSAILNRVIQSLMNRAQVHDQSKLEDFESDTFEIYTAKLKGCTYGSPEYKQFLKDMKPALDHHYANNRHHPEFHEEGIQGMSLVDLLEMVVDWKAATLRHADGDIMKSLELNQERFGYSDELKQIFINTVKEDLS